MRLIGRHHARLALLAGCVGVLACAPSNELNTRISSLEGAVAKLEVSHHALQENTTGLREQLSRLDVKCTRLLPTDIDLDPSVSKFGVLHTTNGHLLVSIVNVQPYSDGQRISLRVGNPYNIDYNGFTLTVKYGLRQPDISTEEDGGDSMDKWIESMAEWEKTVTTKRLKLSDDLLAGKWNKVSFVLAPATPNQVGYINLAISTDTVSLRQ